MSSPGKASVLLIGSGGVGTMAAYALETGGRAEVTAVCRSNYDAVKTAGFCIDSLDHGQGIKGFKPTHILSHVPNVQQSGSQYDFLVVTTKNIPDVKPTVLDIIEKAVTPGVTAIVLLQNGLNIEKPIVERFPENVVLSGVSLIGATEFKLGSIRHDDRDRGKLGPFPGQQVDAQLAEARGKEFVEMYTACGKVDWAYDEDVNFTRWRKLVYNSTFNPVSAILGMDTARMRMSRSIIDDLVKPAMLEIVAIAKAAGVDLQDSVVQEIITVDPTDTAFMPSMGQDAAKGNFIESETIVGEPLREAERLGVPAPTLRTIYGFLRGIQLKAKESRGLWEPKFEPDNPYA
ncbi:related to ketopantoate reductase [Ramularia collo-cygni]|uniref:2-dehydropantoate 2-reductase n=1 Tax=Ramularia collo-cygni TaxID=112498 RepID=A0A2D3VEK3_9PEZI|nr:related to ketopantoate reductase [Ramularia collo-cygni]CZT23502.1 related to ketopantoate reductase [Ramularia collo-cygni]